MFLRSLVLTVLISRFPMLIVPLSVSQNLIKSLRSVDFPLPLFPTIPVTSPFNIFIEKSSSIFSSSYENVTFSELIPSKQHFPLQKPHQQPDFHQVYLTLCFLLTNVLCNVLPSDANATAGPNDENRAIDVRSTPSKPILPQA